MDLSGPGIDIKLKERKESWNNCWKTAEPEALALTNQMWMNYQLKKKENPIEDDIVLDLAHPQLNYPIVQ